MARIYQFAEFEIHREADRHGLFFEQNKMCPHLHLSFDENGHTIECLDCGKENSAWWAFMSLVERFQAVSERIKSKEALIKKDEERLLTHRAAIAVEDAWRKHKYVPTCPHCNEPILPQDKFGFGLTSAKSGALPLQMKANLAIVAKDEMA